MGDLQPRQTAAPTTTMLEIEPCRRVACGLPASVEAIQDRGAQIRRRHRLTPPACILASRRNVSGTSCLDTRICRIYEEVPLKSAIEGGPSRLPAMERGNGEGGLGGPAMTRTLARCHVGAPLCSSSMTGRHARSILGPFGSGGMSPLHTTQLPRQVSHQITPSSPSRSRPKDTSSRAAAHQGRAPKAQTVPRQGQTAPPQQLPCWCSLQTPVYAAPL